MTRSSAAPALLTALVALLVLLLSSVSSALAVGDPSSASAPFCAPRCGAR